MDLLRLMNLSHIRNFPQLSTTDYKLNDIHVSGNWRKIARIGPHASQVSWGLRGCKSRPAPFTRRLNQALSVLSLSLDFFECVCCAVNKGHFLCCVIHVFCVLVVLVRLSVPVQAIDLKDSSLK